MDNNCSLHFVVFRWEKNITIVTPLRSRLVSFSERDLDETNRKLSTDISFDDKNVNWNQKKIGVD